jgi:Tol biopolymer transport system component
MLGLAAVAALTLQLVNVSTGGLQAAGSTVHVDISGDGRLVAFDSLAANLSPSAVGNPDQEVYLRNRPRGRTRLVSRNSRGRAGNAWSWMPSLSPNGRFLAFCSTASNLARPDRLPRVPHTGPGLDPHTDVFVRDLRRGVTRRASSDRRGRMANAGSCRPSVADTGDVAFESEASDLVRDDTNGFIETFVYDWSSRRVRALARRPGGGTAGSAGAAISAEGRYVAFYTGERLVPEDTDALGDAYLYDRRGTTLRVVSPGPAGCFNELALELTPRARHVLHWCDDGLRVLDRRSGEVANASPTMDGRPPDRSVTDAGISADGGTVVFCSEAYNLGAPSDGLGDHVFAWQRGQTPATVVAPASHCTWAAGVSADGRTAAFAATLPGLVPEDDADVRQGDAFVAGPLR